MKIKNFLLIFIILAFSLIFVNSANSASFDSDNATTENIQQIIDNSVGDTEIILDGSKDTFKNLSKININKSNIKISGINNATIIRNISNTGNLILFNITGTNITIENLIIRGYDTTINSNSSNLIIQGNIILSNEFGITIATNENIENIKFIKNTIEAQYVGIDLVSWGNKVEGITFADNNIESVFCISINSEKDGPFWTNFNNLNFTNNTLKSLLESYIISISLNTRGNMSNISFTNNSIESYGEGSVTSIALTTVNGNNGNGVYSNFNFTNNIIKTRGTSQIFGILIQTANNISNLNFVGNVLETFGATTGSNSGIQFYSGYGNIRNVNIIDNNVTVNCSNIYTWGIFFQSGIYSWNPELITENVNITGNNIIMLDNGTAIAVPWSNATNFIVSYNRILSNVTFIEMMESEITNLFSANWLGNNTPDLDKVIKIIMDSYYIMNTNLVNGSVYVGDNWVINYRFTLNGTDDTGNWWKLPIFYTTFTDDEGSNLSTILARESNLVNILTTNITNNMPITISTDYESNILYVSSEENPTPIPTPTPTPTPTPIPTPTQDPVPSANNNTNKTNNNPVVDAAMKKTGIPIVIIAMLFILGVVTHRKKL